MHSTLSTPDWCRIEDDLHVAKVRAHGAADASADLFAATGLSVPASINRFSGDASLMLAAIGPGEWLLAGDRERLSPISDRIAATLRADASIVLDITSGRRSFMLTGVAGLACLAAMTPLDLGEAAFPPGFAGRTRFGDIGIFVARFDDTPSLRIIIDQSQEDYFRHLLNHPF